MAQLLVDCSFIRVIHEKENHAVSDFPPIQAALPKDSLYGERLKSRRENQESGNLDLSH